MDFLGGVTKADGKLTLLVNLGGLLALEAVAFGYPSQLTPFSLPISGPLRLDEQDTAFALMLSTAARRRWRSKVPGRKDRDPRQ